jgi:transposase
MAEPLVLDGLWTQIESLLPQHPPNPRGGRRRKPDRSCLEGVVYVLKTGTQWQQLPRSSLWPSGSTCWRRFKEWTMAGVWAQLHCLLLNLLGAAGAIDLSRVVVDSASLRAKKGGEHTGPNPTDRGKNGTKRHIISEAQGLPLIVTTTPANIRDEVPFIGMLDTIPPIKMPSGQRRHRPLAAVGDRGYGFPWIIAQVTQRRIKSFLARRGSPHGSGMGRVRYVIERTMSWIDNFRRIACCYERTGNHWQAFNELACCIICANRLRRIQCVRMAA